MVTSLLFLCLLLFQAINCSSLSNSNVTSTPQLCSHGQALALLHFSKSFSIKSWEPSMDFHYPKTKSWKEGTDCCNWDGVTCNTKTGQVIGLDLAFSMLYGTLRSNSSLFFLRHLQKLDLSYNDFNHSLIPSPIGQLLHLTNLNLAGSNFAGKVPSEFSHPSRLESLDLSYNAALWLEQISFNKLTQNLTQLRELELSEVDMSLVMPSSLMNLSSSLSSLKLRSCGLQGELPDNIFGRSNIQLLNLEGNQDLTGSFPSPNVSNALSDLTLSMTRISIRLQNDLINNMRSIKVLDLSGCNFTRSNLALFSNLTQLTWLDLSSNYFGGHIPFSVGRLEMLNYLSLRSNNFIGLLPNDFVNLTQLIGLDLSDNGFEGVLPSSITNLTQLAVLSISHNNFDGLIPFFFQNFNLLQYLDLSSNNLYGPIPDDFGNLTQLTRLDISHNGFHGQFSFFLGNFHLLQWLDLSFNNFFGHIPYDFCNLTKLIWLDISHNNFHGRIPSLLGNLENLIFLRLSFNNFSCEIPDGLTNLTKLQYLDLSNNRLIGKIPSQMSPFFSDSLEYIDFSHNKLQGHIPSSIFKLENLQALMLSSNDKLTGEISSVICNLNVVEILDLSNNSFSGFIPQCLGNFSNSISVLHLGGNNLHGTITSTFLKCNSLKYLNLNGNRLQGVIPPSITNCMNLIFLDLGSNVIEGTFPSFLETLQTLEVLVLRSNKFYGPVANCSFPKLRIFHLSNNSFNGSLPVACFSNFNAMMNGDHDMEYMMDANYSYDYSVSMTWKGLEIDFVKIHTELTSVDLSDNKFSGEIPKTIGKLISLEQLNLSHNHLAYHIQPSLGTLINLESLDLSSNMLTGRIPIQLAGLKFLAVLNLSNNQLEGSIPGGWQFNTFGSDAYEGNTRLCGFPLEVKCNNDEEQQQSPTNFQKKDNSVFDEGFTWKPVAIGYGCGFAFGATIGYIVLRTRQPTWLLRMIRCIPHQNAKRTRKIARRNHGKRNLLVRKVTV